MNLGQLGIFGRLSLIVAALAIPFTALCVWMILQLAQFARDDQRASLIYAARSISAAVDAQLGIIDTLGQVLSNSPALLNDDLPAFEQEVRRTIAPGSDSWAMVADLQGQQLLNTALPAGQPLPVRSARGLVAQRKAFATHHSIVSEVLKGTATNVWIATIDVPIFKDGKPFRELVVSMDVKFFAGLLNAQNLPNGWRAAIVDSSDRFVALEPLRFGPGDRAVSYWREGATRGDSFEYVSRGGSRLVGSAVKSTRSDWIIGVAVLKEVLETEVTRAVTWVSLAAAGILAASFAFALWMARSIIRPINELGENAEALARGAPGREPELPEARRVWSVLQHAWEQLRVSEDRLRRASQAAGFGIHDLEPASGRSWWSVHLARLLGLRDDDASGSIDRVWSQLHPDEREATRKRLGEVMRQVGPYELELHVQLPDGTQRWLLDCGESTGPLDPHSGLATRLTGIVIDITERKENEQRIRLLMREVTHRSKNLLSLVLAIARRTAASNPQEFLARFNERVLALSASHDLLVESDWRGIDLADLIHAQLAHFTDHLDERIVITGPPVRLQTSAAQSIGMALHELATNAGKYGALSGARGQIEIVWSLSDDATEQGFCLTWRESHGPRVITPARDGFGTLVTGELLVNALSARVDRDYAQAGFCWSLRCPARVVIEDNLETTN